MPPKAALKPGGKKGPPAAMIAKIKQKLSAQQQEKERKEREEKEEEKRLLEELRLAEEQRKFEEKERLRLLEEKKVTDTVNKKKAKEEVEREKNREVINRMIAAGTLSADAIQGNNTAASEDAELKRRKKKQLQKQKEEEEKAKTEIIDDREDWEIEADAIEAEEQARKQKEKEMEEEKINAARENGKNLNLGTLRSPIVCVMGHVDAGKTSLLDYIRHTSVQKGEAGGITQQIGATFFPMENIIDATSKCSTNSALAETKNTKIPGLLVIDTPGHESFGNLRSRGTSICDVAVVVIDMHSSIEKTTIETIKLLRKKKCPFIIAINKIDRLYDWKSDPDSDIKSLMDSQSLMVKTEFQRHVERITEDFVKLRGELMGLSFEEYGTLPPAILYYENPDFKSCISMVPISAKTGDGVNDLLLLMVELVQRYMSGKVTLKDQLDCVVLEVKHVDGFGMTMDVILVNGVLHEGDTIVVPGVNGPIKTVIRCLLTPQPMKELRIKSSYVKHQVIHAAMGVKVVAEGLSDVIPGASLRVVNPGEDFEEISKEVQSTISQALTVKNQIGVAVQASTLGSLEALLSFLSDNKIPVSSIAIGPVHKRHIQPVLAMKNKCPKYAVLLAFDVPITERAKVYVKNELKDDKETVTVFSSNIIYKLTEMFLDYIKKFNEEEYLEKKKAAVYPVIFKIKSCIRSKDPILLEISVLRGNLHLRTPLCIIKNGKPLQVGIVTGIRENRDDAPDIEVGEKANDYIIRIENQNKNFEYGIHFDDETELISFVTRTSIDALKGIPDNGLDQDSINLLRNLAKLLNVPPPISKAIS